jgi:hypothetical protein
LIDLFRMTIGRIRPQQASPAETIPADAQIK